MTDLKCAFSAPLIAGDFACAAADQVTRRGGPDIACRSQAGNAGCAQLLALLKAAALPVFGVDDDLLAMPHSVLVKIQYGGLLGLQRQLQPGPAAVRVDDIQALVQQARSAFGDLARVPCQDLVESMTGHTVKRRRR
jgi:hypothetical protein